jgi:protein phosphatase 2C family protein 2/3
LKIKNLNTYFAKTGNLALSRALGDFIFKRNTDKRAEEQVVTGKKQLIKKKEILYIKYFLAAPDVVVKTITEDWEFILIACDGIWDVLSNEEVLKFVRARVAQQMPPDTVQK